MSKNEVIQVLVFCKNCSSETYENCESFKTPYGECNENVTLENIYYHINQIIGNRILDHIDIFGKDYQVSNISPTITVGDIVAKGCRIIVYYVSNKRIRCESEYEDENCESDSDDDEDEDIRRNDKTNYDNMFQKIRKVADIEDVYNNLSNRDGEISSPPSPPSTSTTTSVAIPVIPKNSEISSPTKSITDTFEKMQLNSDKSTPTPSSGDNISRTIEEVENEINNDNNNGNDSTVQLVGIINGPSTHINVDINDDETGENKEEENEFTERPNPQNIITDSGFDEGESESESENDDDKRNSILEFVFPFDGNEDYDNVSL